MFHKAWNAPDFPVPSRLGAGPNVPWGRLLPFLALQSIRLSPFENRLAFST